MLGNTVNSAMPATVRPSTSQAANHERNRSLPAHRRFAPRKNPLTRCRIEFYFAEIVGQSDGDNRSGVRALRRISVVAATKLVAPLTP
jgi:hypothetical protein